MASTSFWGSFKQPSAETPASGAPTDALVATLERIEAQQHRQAEQVQEQLTLLSRRIDEATAAGAPELAAAQEPSVPDQSFSSCTRSATGISADELVGFGSTFKKRGIGNAAGFVGAASFKTAGSGFAAGGMAGHGEAGPHGPPTSSPMKMRPGEESSTGASSFTGTRIFGQWSSSFKGGSGSGRPQTRSMDKVLKHLKAAQARFDLLHMSTLSWSERVIAGLGGCPASLPRLHPDRPWRFRWNLFHCAVLLGAAAGSFLASALGELDALIRRGGLEPFGEVDLGRRALPYRLRGDRVAPLRLP